MMGRGQKAVPLVGVPLGSFTADLVKGLDNLYG